MRQDDTATRLLPIGYRLDLVSDPSVVVLRRQDETVVARFTHNVAPGEIRRVAEEDYQGTQGTPKEGSQARALGTKKQGASAGVAGVDASRPLEKKGGRGRGDKEDLSVLRVLVSFDDTHRSYRVLIARALRKFRPHLEVRHAPLDDLDAQLRSFEPHVVVCSLPNSAANGAGPIASAASARRGAWVAAPVDTSRPAEVCLDGEVWNTDGPPLSEVLDIIDETEARLSEGRLEGGC